MHLIFKISYILNIYDVIKTCIAVFFLWFSVMLLWIALFTHNYPRKWKWHRWHTQSGNWLWQIWGFVEYRISVFNDHKIMSRCKKIWCNGRNQRKFLLILLFRFAINCTQCTRTVWWNQIEWKINIDSRTSIQTHKNH